MVKIKLATSQAPFTYHNAAETTRTRRGLTVSRVPEAWRQRFPERTAWRALQAGGVELRFRANTQYIALNLALTTHIAYASTLALYHGNRNVGLATVNTPNHRGKVVLLDRDAPIDDALDRPWRILLPYGAEATLSALHLSDGVEILPAEPRPVRWLAHGDSITQGAHALHPGMTWVNLVGDALGWDALNLGFGGSAWGDAVVAEYIASRADWDLLSIAIGTNTFGQATDTAEEYGTKYNRFLDIIREAHPNKPILCVTPFWRGADATGEPNAIGCTHNAYRHAVVSVVSARMDDDPALELLHGLEVLGDERGLTVDLVHPDPHGMQRIAECLTPRLQALWERSAQRE